MRTFGTFRLFVTEDSDQLRKLVDQVMAFDDTSTTTSSEYQGSLVVLDAAAADVQVPFGGVGVATCVAIVAYSDVDVKLGGVLQTPISLKTTPASSNGSALSVLQRTIQPGGLFLRGEVSSIHLSNPSATATARVFVGVVGNAS